jgi:hypothetical protein
VLRNFFIVNLHQARSGKHFRTHVSNQPEMIIPDI